jgi:hypothetical protein
MPGCMGTAGGQEFEPGPPWQGHRDPLVSGGQTQ